MYLWWITLLADLFFRWLESLGYLFLPPMTILATYSKWSCPDQPVRDPFHSRTPIEIKVCALRGLETETSYNEMSTDNKGSMATHAKIMQHYST